MIESMGSPLRSLLPDVGSVGAEQYTERFCCAYGSEHPTSKARPFCAGCDLAGTRYARKFKLQWPN